MKVIVSLSGGLDSTALLARAVARGHEIMTYGFYYGSKHNRYENAAAQKIADYYGVPFQLMDLSSIFQHIGSNLLLTGGPVPEGHYEAESMKQTIVPGRNMIFLSILAGIAMSRGFQEVWIGTHAGDHAIYPDCRPDFINAMCSAILRATDNAVELQAPFMYLNKSGIISGDIHANKMIATPWHLTRTCYKDQELACGRCGSCTERLEAFRACNMTDPIQYEGHVLS